MPNHSNLLSLYKLIILASKTLHINKLKKHFNSGEKITVQNIIDFYKQFEHPVKRSTIDWRIYKLTQENILYRVSRGVYSLLKKEPQYIPEIARSLKNLAGSIRNQFPYIDSCIWSTKWLSEFMLHQPGQFYTLIEVEKEVMDAVFYTLNEQRKEIFLNPSIEVLDNYVSLAKNPIIIKALITESPLIDTHHVMAASLEKILVDIYCEPDLYAGFQGAELKRIYQNASEKYVINEPKMLRYANRRGKKEEIEKLIANLKLWQ